MGKDWDAVAEAINTRLDELQMTQQELSISSGVSTATLRELQHNRNPRRRSNRLLEAISTGLRWPAGHLARVLEGGTGSGHVEADLRAELDQLRGEVSALRERMDVLEGRQSG
jgi:uncharacterized protein YceH (UPF0502 family)